MEKPKLSSVEFRAVDEYDEESVYWLLETRCGNWEVVDPDGEWVATAATLDFARDLAADHCVGVEL